MKKLFLIIICFLSFITFDAFAQVKSFRLGQSVGSLRLVFDMSKNVDYKVFLLTNPNRLVVDLSNSSFVSGIVNDIDKNAFISSARLSADNKRMVFDLLKPVNIKKHFVLQPQSNLPWRLVVDIEPASQRDFDGKSGENAVSSNASKGYKPALKMPAHQKKIIVLDPGHGGQDPGAIGYSGTYEKHITLTFAKELKELLERNGSYRVYLTRSGDSSVALRDRVKIGRKYDADLFMSIHADSIRNKDTKGLSVYTLSETASDKEAAALAEKENKADIVAGLNFAEHSKEVADILINLAQRETMNKSAEYATVLVREMGKQVVLLSNTHRFAGFAVLKAPDVPSVLLEMGYLSNRQEEKQLKDKNYRKKLATSSVNAINKFFGN